MVALEEGKVATGSDEDHVYTQSIAWKSGQL